MGITRPQRLSRREFVAASALAGVTVAGLRLPPGALGAGPSPPGFPAGIEIYKSTFENWALEIVMDDLWTCAPRTPRDVVRLANWAHAQGWRLRPRGKMHGWSPFTVRAGMPGLDRTVLVDTTEHLTAVELLTAPSAVRAQAGATMDLIVPLLKDAGHGIAAIPSTGNVTIGGCLAIDAHAAVSPARGEERLNGLTYGTMANLVLELTAVVWDRRRKRYVLRRFEREDRDCKALLTNLGRTFITEATLRTGPGQRTRCVSITDVPATRVFAAPATAGPDSFRDLLDAGGRIETIRFPFTDRLWTKVWSLAPSRPAGARSVGGPYSYVFSDEIPPAVTAVAGQIIAGNAAITPAFGNVMLAVSEAGLAATASGDIWGSSMDLARYIRPTTLRFAELGHAVITQRSRVQKILHDFNAEYVRLEAEYAARGLYPLNGPVEIRVSGLDRPQDCGVRGAEPSVRSALRKHPDRPKWDCCVWLNVLTIANTPGSAQALRRLERWIFHNLHGGQSVVRPEWSKGWAVSKTRVWDDRRILSRVIPDMFRDGHEKNDDWDWAVSRLDRYDPHHVFSNAFLDRFVR